jgi:hypothetical protein
LYLGIDVVVEVLLWCRLYVNSVLPPLDSRLPFLYLYSLSVCVCVVRSRKRAKELKVTVKEVVWFEGSVLKVSLRSKYTSATEKCIYRKSK